MRMTAHALARGKERLGLSRAAMVRLAPRALAEGRPVTAFGGAVRRYLDGLRRDEATHLRIYGEHVWLFAGETLVTVFRVPSVLKRRARQQARKGGR